MENETKISDLNIELTCRTCLSTNKKLNSLFDTVENEKSVVSLGEILANLASIEVSAFFVVNNFLFSMEFLLD